MYTGYQSISTFLFRFIGQYIIIIITDYQYRPKCSYQCIPNSNQDLHNFIFW